MTCLQAGRPCRLGEAVKQLRKEVNTLAELVNIDELTGLYNFRHFSKVIEVEMERSRRSGKPVSLLILDLDNFKRLNDKYGHDFGNQALAALGSFLQQVLRKPDVPCRFGGEEFTVILPDTTLEEAVGLAQRLRAGIAAIGLNKEGQPVSMSASFGVADFHADSQETWQQFVQRTDGYLLEAKSQGKNCVRHPDLTEEQGLSSDEREALHFDDEEGSLPA
ncbi:MAG: GGDEF domain-containing protein [Pseudomonadales bacterium]|nr:GGDEF domain-containing protein [Pseudomonadales bacterium]